jgi:hypothetical protein
MPRRRARLISTGAIRPFPRMLSDFLKRFFGGTAPPSERPQPTTGTSARTPADDPARARARWERELEHDPLYAPAHAALAELDRREGRPAAAIAHYLTVVSRFPDQPEILNNLGTLYIQTGDFHAAIERLERAVALSDGLAVARDNLARALLNARQFAEAETHERALLAASPDSTGLHFRLAHTLLMQGKLDEGWPEYEWRLRRDDFAWGRKGLPAWTGDDPAGRALRVIMEQGLGDAILFARFVPALAARCGRVQFLVRPALARLFRESFAHGNVEIATDPADVAGLDGHVHLASLPYRLGLGRDALRETAPYLRAPEAARARWHPRVAALPGLRIGIVWAGNPERRGDESRSLAPEILAPLAQAQPGAMWVSLQAGAAPDAPRPFALALDPMPEVADYADTAAIIEALDLVVSVDTSVAHAAAALGKPVIVLAPHNVCWRWQMGGIEGAVVESPWYRGVRVLRAGAPGAWDAVVQDAAAAIGAAAAAVSRAGFPAGDAARASTAA